MAAKKKNNNRKQQSAKDDKPDNKFGLWQTLITVLGTIIVAYFGYLGVVTIPKLSIVATQTAHVQSLGITQTAFALLPIPTFTSTLPPLDASTPTPTVTFTHIPPSPTVTRQPPATSTPRPLSACIDSQTWTVDSTDVDALNDVSVRSDGCYAMEPLGTFIDGMGKLHLYYRDQKKAIASGIHTPINDNAVIEFKVYVNSMYIVYTDNPVTVSFAVAPAGDPMLARNTARFKLHVEGASAKPYIHFVLADVGESAGTKVGSQHYEYGRTYTIRLELIGNTMRVYINGLKMDETLAIPTGQKVFYIGYNIPIIGGVDVEVSDVTVDGLPR